MTDGNEQPDNHARQKQEIQKLLSGQSQTISTDATGASSSKRNVPSKTTSNTTPSTNIPSTELTDSIPLREDKLSLAVSFLSSPKVQTADKSRKTAFLKQKGLTDPEIKEAYRRTNSADTEINFATSQAIIPGTTTANTSSVSLPPVVPSRVHSSRPTQIVYYSPSDPERLTGKRMLAMALILGAGAVGLTAGLVGIVKVFVSPIFNSIVNYQRNRYNDRYDKLQRLGDLLRQQLKQGADDKGGTSLGDSDDNDGEKLDTAKPVVYLSTLIKEQRILMDRMDRLVSISQQHVADEQEPYGKIKNTLLNLKEVLNRPEYNFSTYTPYSMYGSTFANRSNTGFDDVAVQGVKSEIRSFKGMLLSRRNFPTAQIKPLPSVVSTSSSTTESMVSKDNKNESDTTTVPATTTSTISSYHPRQRQNSYRAELQAKAKAAETGTTTMTNFIQSDSGDNALTEPKIHSEVIED